MRCQIFAFTLVSLAFGAVRGWGQSETSPVPVSSGAQAVSVVLRHYAINPHGLDPKTQQPLPGNGNWSISNTPPASCPKGEEKCVEVFYEVSAEPVRCSWVVVLNADGNDGTFLEENDNAERYMLRTVSPDEARTLIASRKKPEFPPIAIAARVEGDVVTEVLVDETGKVQGVTVVSGPPMEQEAAREAARDWHFKPLMVGTRAVPFVVQLVFTFKTAGPGYASVAIAP